MGIEVVGRRNATSLVATTGTPLAMARSTLASTQSASSSRPVRISSR
jgi:hypothetical protein